MQENYEKINSEMEPFLVDGKIMRLSKLKWLSLRQAIRIGKYEEEIVLVQQVGEKISSKHYENMYKILEWYCYERDRRNKGIKETKKVENITNEIIAEEIPF